MARALIHLFGDFLKASSAAVEQNRLPIGRPALLDLAVRTKSKDSSNRQQPIFRAVFLDVANQREDEVESRHHRLLDRM